MQSGAEPVCCCLLAGAESLHSLLKSESPGGKAGTPPGQGEHSQQHPLIFQGIGRQHPNPSSHFPGSNNLPEFLVQRKTSVLKMLYFWKAPSNFKLNFVTSAKKGQTAWEKNQILIMRSDHQNGLKWKSKKGESLSKLQKTQVCVQQVSPNVFPIFPFIPIFSA